MRDDPRPACTEVLTCRSLPCDHGTLLEEPTRGRNCRDRLRGPAPGSHDIWGIAMSDDSIESLKSDASRRGLIRLSLNLVPFAGIAFLWFIGVVRESLGDVEDRLFSTVFLGSGLLFLAMLFVGARTRRACSRCLTGPASTRTSMRTAATAPKLSCRCTACGWPRCSPCRSARWVYGPGRSRGGFPTLDTPPLGPPVGGGEHRWTQLVFPSWVLLVSLMILLRRQSQGPRVEPGPRLRNVGVPVGGPRRLYGRTFAPTDWP